MRNTVLSVAMLALAACSSAPQYTDITKAVEVNAVDEMTSGVVTVRTDKSGKTANVVIVGSAPIRGETAADEALAYRLADMDARAKFSEFNGNNIRTNKKNTTNIDDVQTVDGEVTTNRKTTSNRSSESVTSNSSQLQRGLVNSTKRIEDGVAYVTLTVSRDTARSARDIKGW